jgi:two-component system, chemotaxis family, chemotaxis protein CheY
MKILIADDNLIQRMVLEFKLKQNHYQVVLATCGQEAWQILESQPDVGLLITDIMMPNMDGLELLRRMKAHPSLQDLPVIMCTALRDSDYIQKATQLGCRYYIVKPVQVQVLLQRVEEALQARKLILREAEESRQKLEMDPATFLSLVVAFENFVNEEIILIEQKVKSSGMDSIRLDLATLYENALLLGAERLSNILVDLQVGADLSAIAIEDYQAMLRELKVLSVSLAAMVARLRSAT